MNNNENSKFAIPSREDVSTTNQAIFDQLQKKLGFVPNLYAYFAKADNALADYLALQNRKSSLSAKEREVINLVTSQINGCRYCQSAHTVIGKMVGFSEEQVLELRQASASFNPKLDALVKFTASVVTHRGRATEESKLAFFDAGYNEANMIDVVIIIGDKIISNYLHNLTGFEIDFPLAEAI